MSRLGRLKMSRPRASNRGIDSAGFVRRPRVDTRRSGSTRLSRPARSPSSLHARTCNPVGMGLHRVASGRVPMSLRGRVEPWGVDRFVSGEVPIQDFGGRSAEIRRQRGSSRCGCSSPRPDGRRRSRPCRRMTSVRGRLHSRRTSVERGSRMAASSCAVRRFSFDVAWLTEAVVTGRKKAVSRGRRQPRSCRAA